MHAPSVGGVDQRGVVRPQGPACDLGAYESDLPGIVGGRNLRIATGSIDLTWDGGDVQTGYTLLRVDTSTSALVTTALPRGAISHTDAAVVNGVVYCFVLVPTGPLGVLGSSDLLCAATGMATGSPLPAGLVLALNQLSTATMTLASGGPVETRLFRIPLDGGLVTNTVVTPGVFTQPVPAAGACFLVLVVGFGGAYGLGNPLCGLPGISTLSAGGRVASVREAMEHLAAVGATIATLPAVTEFAAGP
ncbi:MAG: hypothetical protein EXR52_08045 [Dehalococcoidia bacterium]|nr:hypothetical protein [Dehalococcoidia bacterium]